MDLSYAVVPFLTWFITGVTKFIVNCLREGRLAYDLIGYGGMPSNHSAIVSSITALIALKEGIDSPAFGIALSFAFIVLLDANSLRRQVGKHAVKINLLSKESGENELLRERVGHTKMEILMGCFLGVIVATALSFFKVVIN